MGNSREVKVLAGMRTLLCLLTDITYNHPMLTH